MLEEGKGYEISFYSYSCDTSTFGTRLLAIVSVILQIEVLLVYRTNVTYKKIEEKGKDCNYGIGEYVISKEYYELYNI